MEVGQLLHQYTSKDRVYATLCLDLLQYIYIHIHMQTVQVYSILPVGAVVLGLARPRYLSGVASVLSYQNKRHISF